MTSIFNCHVLSYSQAPAGFSAVMSAAHREELEDNRFFFKMDHPIPTYLIAIAVGEMASKEIGPRSRVWAEPCMLVCDMEGPLNLSVFNCKQVQFEQSYVYWEYSLSLINCLVVMEQVITQQFLRCISLGRKQFPVMCHNLYVH